jgi:hypothetical protein
MPDRSRDTDRSESSPDRNDAPRRPNRGGRPPVLDDTKRRQVVAILSLGGSRRTAARFVGCAVSTIQNTALRNPAFDEQLRHAEGGPQIEFLKRVRTASAKEQCWRAATWALERLNAEEFGKRNPELIPLDQARRLMDQLAEILTEEIGDRDVRLRIVRRVERVTEQLRAAAPQPARVESDDEPNEDVDETER